MFPCPPLCFLLKLISCYSDVSCLCSVFVVNKKRFLKCIWLYVCNAVLRSANHIYTAHDLVKVRFFRMTEPECALSTSERMPTKVTLLAYTQCFFTFTTFKRIFCRSLICHFYWSQKKNRSMIFLMRDLIVAKR